MLRQICSFFEDVLAQVQLRSHDCFKLLSCRVPQGRALSKFSRFSSDRFHHSNEHCVNQVSPLFLDLSASPRNYFSPPLRHTPVCGISLPLPLARLLHPLLLCFVFRSCAPLLLTPYLVHKIAQVVVLLIVVHTHRPYNCREYTPHNKHTGRKHDTHSRNKGNTSRPPSIFTTLVSTNRRRAERNPKRLHSNERHAHVNDRPQHNIRLRIQLNSMCTPPSAIGGGNKSHRHGV